MTFLARLGRAIYVSSPRSASPSSRSSPSPSFYFPRRRARARLAPSGELSLVARADRYVDLRREFGRLLEDVVSRRSGTGAGDEARQSP